MSDKLTRKSFIDAILGEPLVPDHRLVFADWLEDRGELEEAEKYRELPGTAALWCEDWGKDVYGLWCELAIGEVTQCLRWIPPGSFWMGSPKEERGRWENEGPRHRVEISRAFWMFDSPCAQELWEAVMGSNPSDASGKTLPVETVSVEDIQAFLDKLNSQLPGLRLRLPREAEWEYACRAGTKGPRYMEDLDRIGWYLGNSEQHAHPVKEKLPNAWGLYDMLGNVWEWCEDELQDYRKEAVADPVGPRETGGERALRGGSWYNAAQNARAAVRRRLHPKSRMHLIGFRCVMSG